MAQMPSQRGLSADGLQLSTLPGTVWAAQSPTSGQTRLTTGRAEQEGLTIPPDWGRL